jgi:hypothetical protein
MISVKRCAAELPVSGPKSNRRWEIHDKGRYMREILIVGVQVLIIAIFVTLLAFYGFVFWHWRNDARRHDLPREDQRSSVAHATSQNHTLLNR